MNQKGFAPHILLILLLIGVGVGLYLVSHPAIFSPKADNTVAVTRNKPRPPSELGIKSVTYYDPDKNTPSDIYNGLQQDIPAIKDAGFNSVWLVSGWKTFNPKPLTSPPTYNDQSFETLKQTLELLKRNNMKVVLPLNYIWSYGLDYPEGISQAPNCDWMSDPTKYRAFEVYIKEFLTRISDYNDMVYIIFFTEATDCNLRNFNYRDPNSTKQLTNLLKQTLGSLPSRLRSDLRNKFSIGFYDGGVYKWQKMNGIDDPPIQSVEYFDFLVDGGYYLEGSFSDEKIESDIKESISHYKNRFPNHPFFIGEFGQGTCHNSKYNFSGLEPEMNQARVLIRIINVLKNQNLAFNLWGWRDSASELDCSTDPANHGLQTVDGRSKWGFTKIRDALNSNPKGFLVADSSCTEITGWSCDDNNYGEAVDVHLYADNTSIQNPFKVIKADQENAGLAENIWACGGTTKHWFTVPVPNSLKDNKPHKITAFGINNPAGTNIQLSNSGNPEKVITCQPSPASPSPSTSPSASPSPVLVTGKLSSNPQTCTINSQGLCTVTISWDAGGPAGSSTKVYANGVLFTGGGLKGSAEAPWISLAGVTFELLVNDQAVDRLTVKAVEPPKGKLSASPSPCVLNNQGLCSSNISWNITHAQASTDVLVYADGVLFSRGNSSGSATAPWIDRDGVNFELLIDGKLLDTLKVTGQSASSPSPSPSPSQSPMPSPKASPKPGDLNNDGKVDIFDFNLFLQDYKNGNLRSDLNNDGKVDIFDFNILLRSFGK